MKKIKYVFLAAALISAMLFSGCGDDNQDDITVTIDGEEVTVNTNSGKEAVTANGSLKTKDVTLSDGEYTLALTDFTYRDSTVKVVVTGTGTSASLECDDNIIDDFDIEVDDSAKSIKVKNTGTNKSYNSMNLTLTVNAPVKTVSCGGSAEITYTAPENCEKVTLEVSGTASLKGSGSCGELVISSSGGSKIDASELSGDLVKVSASGESDISVKANQTLKISADGASHVKYSCDSDDVTEDVSGSATVDKA